MRAHFPEQRLEIEPILLLPNKFCSFTALQFVLAIVPASSLDRICLLIEGHINEFVTSEPDTFNKNLVGTIHIP